jgi:hypothetical protein
MCCWLEYNLIASHLNSFATFAFLFFASLFFDRPGNDRILHQRPISFNVCNAAELDNDCRWWEEQALPKMGLVAVQDWNC